MEQLFYETKPYALMGVGGGAGMMHGSSDFGLICAFILVAAGGIIFGMRDMARNPRPKVRKQTRRA